MIEFNEDWKRICTSKKTFDTLANFPVHYQLVLENILDTLGQENEEENMQLSSKQILHKIVAMSTTSHFIPPEDVTTNLIEQDFIKLHQIKGDNDEVSFQVEYSKKLTKPKGGGINFWIVLLLLLMLSPALLRKILGFIR
uniref:Uncharacterized protein n=2 Tax=Vannella robusta TaxID=1487602 RepID=A0A7S4MPB5_9EUKA|mmetsp:Transcript_548/g.726  ORF Transcript_548/g.726 Transcript_548/m.726 type:complete len:140 (+) Transcript_548:454-873(+)